MIWACWAAGSLAGAFVVWAWLDHWPTYIPRREVDYGDM